MIEWESTISIAITEDEFMANTRGMLKFLKPSTPAAATSDDESQPPITIDVLFLYRNGIRCAGRQLQRKVTTNCRNLLSFYHNHWYAIKRTTATETPIDVDAATNNAGSIGSEISSAHIEKVIFRYITLYANGVRVSYNREETDMGCKYMVEYEIEYPANSTYLEIVQAERKLMRLIHVNDTHRCIEREQLTLETVFSCVMSKVQMWHCFDANLPYVWAYKWNGIKAKMLITNIPVDNTNTGGGGDDVGFLTYLWPDSNSVETLECVGPATIVSAMQNLCLSVEVLDDRIIVIEAIGALINDTIYTTEPATNVSILKYFQKKLKTNTLRLGTKPLMFQEFFKAPFPKTYNLELHDGFVICQNDIIIKWKIPTIDVKCIAPYTFTVAEQIIDTEPGPGSIAGDIGKIYEMSFKNEILRQRNDRIAPSSQQEYKIFIESSKNLL